MVSTLDIMSGGRLELGIGAGWNEQESGAYGIPLGTPGERSDRFEEACEILVSLLSQETTTYAGTHYQMTDARNDPKGPQQPHPPICIGGSGEKRTLRTAARFAQHWNFMGGTPEAFAHKRDILHQHCQDVGRDPSEIMLSSHVQIDERGVEATAEHVSELANEGLDLAIVYLRPPLSPAILTPLAEALAPLR
jgi:alkanesulfonate monooxygenase SsuD/methylene tetrahydromethanopterin reductase-like flavin-dependent oxidoreductase (luciferase family)